MKFEVEYVLHDNSVLITERSWPEELTASQFIDNALSLLNHKNRFMTLDVLCFDENKNKVLKPHVLNKDEIKLVRFFEVKDNPQS